MIDIETMGNTHEAAMIQLAACYFDIGTGETGDSFDMCIDLDSALDYGFVKNKSTEDWWKEQNQDVLNDILSRGQEVKGVIEKFAVFIKNADRVWSHATFDFVIVQNYLKKFTKKQMPYRGAMDIRTLVYLSGINLDDYQWSNKTHNALDDCKFQINYCTDAYKIIKSDARR